MTHEHRTMKSCTKCGVEKSLTEFGKRTGARDGLQPNCRACNRVAVDRWQAANIDKMKIYRAATRDKAKARSAAWYAANTEKTKVKGAVWKSANPEARRIHKHNRRARETEAGGELSTGVVERLFRLQRGKCACGCKQPLGDDFHRDHIMPLALGGTNEDWNMQLLTATCNLQKSAKHPVEFMQGRGFLL